MIQLRKYILTFFLLAGLLTVCASHAQAAPRLDGTDHTGALTTSETWTPAGNPHYVNGTVTIPPGMTLTIQPGVIVRSLTSYYFGGFVVQGVLNATGTADNKIIFTSKDDSASAQWAGVKILGEIANLAHAEVRYGGGGGYGLPCFNESATVCVQAGGSLTIDDVYFHDNAPQYDHWSGVVTAYSANESDVLNVSIQNSRFEVNKNVAYTTIYYPVILDGPGIQLSLAGNTFANNQVDRILLHANAMKNQAALTLPAQTGLEAYEMWGDWVVPASQTLTLTPGVTILAEHGDYGRGVGLVMQGKLIAQGTDAQKITLDATDPAYGWSGLAVRGASGLAQLSHVQILHGGKPGLTITYEANLVVEDSARLELSDSRVANLVSTAANYAFGALVVKNAIAVLNGNTIADNMPVGATAGVYAINVSGPQSRLEMTNNSFSGNFINAVLLGSDGLGATINTLRPQSGLLGYDIGVPYAAETYVLQPAGQLTLEAGVHMRAVNGPWGKGIYLNTQGQLRALGSAEAPVVFKAAGSSDPAAWGGIYINGGTAELIHTRVENAGRGQEYPTPGPYPSLWVAAGGQLTLLDSTVTANRTSGQVDVGVLVEDASATLIHSTFSGLGNLNENDYPLKISGAASRLELRGSTFGGNALTRALLANNALTGADFSLAVQDGLSGYELQNTLTLPAGITLSAAPGVTIYGRSGAGLVIRGRLIAERGSGLPVVFTSAANTTAGGWAGLIFDGAAASGSLEGAILRCGGGSLSGGSGYPAGGLVFYNLAADAVRVRRSAISVTSTAGWQIYNSSVLQAATLDGNRLSANSGVGLRLSGTSQVLQSNLAVLDNESGGVNLDQSGVQLTLLQATLARNKLYGLRAANGASATLTNAILARNVVAARVETGGSLAIDTALWDGNTTDTAGAGTVTSLNRFNGAAAFDPTDGYHLTQYSEAAGKGQNAGVTADLDGTTRPQPAGSAPDLGADEFNQAAALTLSAEKLALPPVWINRPDASSNPFGTLLQQYWVRFHYGAASGQTTPLNVSVEDTLPAGLAYQAEAHSPQMSFSHNGQQLSWQTSQAVAPQSTVDIQVDTLGSDLAAGSQLTNQAVVSAGSQTFNLSAVTSVPVFSPLVTWPVNGELCALSDHSLSVEGSAQPGTTIEVYEGAVLKSQSVTDAHGLFKISYTGSQAGLANLNLRARACASGSCSDFTQIHLAEPLSFWDPQRSWWEGDPIVGPMAGKHVSYKFRDEAGLASSDHWIIPGVYGFSDTTLHLFACQDPATSKMPTQIWITADSHVYIPVAVDGNLYTYKIGASHTVKMQVTYRKDPPPLPPDPNDPPPPPDPEYPPEIMIDDGSVLVDPDGYIFNATQGFDPQNPSQHAIAGARATCMAYLPGWGGWVPWPAHLYNQQVNPQVVGANGYFAFFVPPGQYYIQVDVPDGYQSWRSPVVTVVNEIVHVNVPLSPVAASPAAVLQSSRAGFSQTTLTLPVGGKVRWEIVQSNQEDSAGLLADRVDPILRMVSSPDPFASTDGWDSGRLYPGQSYTRRFEHAGSYTYTDSAGHTATILVTDQKFVYLPSVRK